MYLRHPRYYTVTYGTRSSLSLPCSEYLEALLAYLTGFYERTQPLAQLGRTLTKVGVRRQEGSWRGRGMRARSGKAAPWLLWVGWVRSGMGG
mgnify:CR=1 FL=1